MCESHPSATRPSVCDERVRKMWGCPLEQRRFIYLNPVWFWEERRYICNSTVLESLTSSLVCVFLDDIPMSVWMHTEIRIVRGWTEGWTTLNVEYEATAWWAHYLEISDIVYHIAIRLKIKQGKGLSLLEGETWFRLTVLNKGS